MLLVESDDEVRTLLKDYFSLIYEVEEANNGEVAYNYAINNLPDIIVSEVSAAANNGLELCAKIKSNISTLHIPVVLLTATPSDEQQAECFKRGADEYIIKPFHMELLLLRCNALVKNKNKIIHKYTNHTDVDLTETGTNTKDKNFMEAANNILEENWDNTDFDTTFWSQSLGIGRTQLFNRIKKITGMTPNDYILYTKMNKSMELLSKEENITIAEVAYQLGFTNPAYFSKCFKKQFGLSPLEFKKNRQQA